MTKLFRYLNSELNGVYIKGMYYFLNLLTNTFDDVFSYAKNMVFKLESEDITGNEIPITEDDLLGIAKIAGVFTPFISAESNAGSILFTNSHIVNGVEYSERGLLDNNEERFIFVRTTQDAYTTDIVTEATTIRQASFIPEGTPVVGYIAEGDVVLTTDGHIIPGAIRSVPPVDLAYMEYYGPTFLFLAETFLVEAFMSADVFKKMFESFQRIRYNGASLSELSSITKLILDDYVSNMYFVPSGNRSVCHYTLNSESELTSKTKKTYIWKLLVSTKYKQLVLQEDIA